MPAIDKESDSDKDSPPAHTVSEPVMAEQITQDVVKEAQSMGGSSLIGDSATTINHFTAGDGDALPTHTAADPKHSHKRTASPSTTQDTEVDSAIVIDQASDEGVDVSRGLRGNLVKTLIKWQLFGTQSLPLPADGAQLEGSSPQSINGTGEDNAGVEDGATQQVIIDASGGSDTDTSKGESTNQLQDTANRHVRANSMKKPTAFKSVSVTKNFLAKAAPSPAARAGDKGT